MNSCGVLYVTSLSNEKNPLEEICNKHRNHKTIMLADALQENKIADFQMNSYINSCVVVSSKLESSRNVDTC